MRKSKPKSKSKRRQYDDRFRAFGTSRFTVKQARSCLKSMCAAHRTLIRSFTHESKEKDLFEITRTLGSLIHEYRVAIRELGYDYGLVAHLPA